MDDCSVEGCSRPSRSKGLCSSHYRKSLRFGTPTPSPDMYKKRGPAPDPSAPRSRHNPDNPTRKRPTKEKVEKTHCKNGHALEPDNYYLHKTSNSKVCKICAKEATRRYRRKVANRDPNWERTHCKNGHPITPENTVVYSGYARCVPCIRIYGQNARLKKYGITAEEYSNMLEEQGGLCRICKDPLVPGKEEHIDHDHVTGKVRGILCTHCNTALGKFRDDPEVILMAAQYIMDSWKVEADNSVSPNKT
jgi:hypothetical protein